MPTPKEHWGYTIQEWSSHDFQTLLTPLENIKVLYDIGANVGGFTHVLKQKFPDLKAYCFEPVQVNYDELVNNLPYANCIKKGIFYGKTESKVLWRGGNDGAYFVEHINSGEPRIGTGEIMELCELENLGLDKPDLIKLDVEGAEENILEHSALIKQTQNLIVEWHPSPDPIEFFAKHLPDHEIRVNLSNMQFLLCLR